MSRKGTGIVTPVVRAGRRLARHLGPGGGASRRAALGVLIRHFPASSALVAVLVVCAGVLPAVFAALVGQLVASLPAVVRSGFGSPVGQSLTGVLAAIGLVLVLQEVVSAASGFTSAVLFRRYDEVLLARVMNATLALPGLELFEDAALAAKADRAVRIPAFGPGEFVMGLLMKGSIRAQGLASAVLVATVWPVAAVLLALVWLVVGRRLQVNFEADPNFGTDPSSWSEPMRRSRYLKEIGLMPAWAKEIRVFGLVDWLADRFGRQAAIVLRELWRSRRIRHRVVIGALTCAIAANAVVLALAARSALAGSLGLGQLTILLQGVLGMAALGSQEGDGFIANGAIAVPDVLELEREVDHRRTTGGRVSAAGRPRREIRFEDVRFAYPGGARPVFDGLDLRIEAGRSVGIVGLNGAGKTTLIKLLTGLETPQGGRVTVDGTNLAELEAASWHRAVAAIFQDFVRYELPARDNIGFGAVERPRGHAYDREILDVAASVGADRILADLPNGLDTPLSTRLTGGVDLSGGQWQRIALARAMAAVRAGARVLVLDEPTAQLDVRAEADVYDRFLDLTRGLTTIVISHRFSTVRRADRIIVLADGRVTEDGSHADLVAAGGRYARLFARQATRYVDTAPGGDRA